MKIKLLSDEEIEDFLRLSPSEKCFISAESIELERNAIKWAFNLCERRAAERERKIAKWFFETGCKQQKPEQFDDYWQMHIEQERQYLKEQEDGENSNEK